MLNRGLLWLTSVSAIKMARFAPSNRLCCACHLRILQGGWQESTSSCALALSNAGAAAIASAGYVPMTEEEAAAERLRRQQAAADSDSGEDAAGLGGLEIFD